MIYCNYCKYYGGFGECRHPSNFVDTYESPRSRYKDTADKRNRNNDCADYKTIWWRWLYTAIRE
jgi:hypothetical protein